MRHRSTSYWWAACTRTRGGPPSSGRVNLADWTITWALEPEGRGARLFLVHEGFGPDAPYQVQAHRIMGGGRRSLVGERLVKVLDEG
ncbi:hypothetical protein [Streptomyces lydicus]|uniref:hypothetical protein n=1 Tax=Streptomyces lydicus TaxID=47763 RepID=UPI0037959D43